MRGKATQTSGACQTYRITPAYAGKSGTALIVGAQLLGSPPPMRGKGSNSNINYVFQRITPAYAGKRPSVLDCINSNPDHPRLCGEKSANSFFSALYLGSPPPMRGKVRNLPLLQPTDRITPAYAGKSF